MAVIILVQVFIEVHSLFSVQKQLPTGYQRKNNSLGVKLCDQDKE